MRTIAYYWGIGGVVLLIGSAVWRLSPHVFELQQHDLSVWQWLLLLAFTAFMLYSEGYKGFHLNFAPRVVVRARGLQDSGKPLLYLLAPLVCMGYLYATRKRQLTSFIITFAIVVLVLLVRLLPQPWRGIVDVGVVAGLGLGILSILWFWLRQDFGGHSPAIAADLP